MFETIVMPVQSIGFQFRCSGDNAQACFAKEWGDPGVLDSANDRPKQRDEVFQAPRCSRATDLPHQQTEIVSGYVGNQTFEDVLVFAQVDAAHSSGVIVMCEASFDSFGPRHRSNALRFPLIRRRFAYTASRASCLPFHLRRPLSGSAI